MKKIDLPDLIKDLKELTIKIQADKNLNDFCDAFLKGAKVLRDVDSNTVNTVLVVLGSISSIPDGKVTYNHSLEVGLLMLYFKPEFESHFKFEMNATDAFIGGLVHDFGKCFISEEILNKPSRLTVDEMNEVKKHTEFGYQKLKDKMSLNVLDIIRYHHENSDGSGYYGLVTEELSPYSLAACCADHFSAISQERPYKRAKTKEETLEIMMSSKLDSGLVSLLS